MIGERVFALFCFVVFVVYFGLHCFRYPWKGDVARYAAAVAALYRDFLWPAHEAVTAVDHASEVFTPYIVAVAGLGRLLDVTPYRALQVVGVLNLISYACAIWLFLRTYSLVRDSWIPAVAFLLISLFLRDHIYLWSSETSYASMRLIQAYPSLFGWAVALMIFSVADRYLERGRAVNLVAISLAIAVLFLSHTITAGWVIGIVGIRCIVELLGWRIANGAPADPNRSLAGRGRRVLIVLGAMISGLALTPLWPYFDITRSPGLLEAPEGSPFGDHPFRDMARLYILALPVAVWFLFLRRHFFLLIAFAATWCALQLFRFLGFEFLNRYAFFQAFFAQVAVAEVVGVAVLLAFGQVRRLPADIRPGRGVRYGIFVLAGATIALTVTAPALATDPAPGEPLLGWRTLMALPSSHDAYYRRLAPLTDYLSATDVVLMPVTSDVFHVAAVTGAKVVAAPHAFTVSHYERRLEDVGRFLTPDVAPEARDEIIRRYQVSRILLTDEYRQLGPELSRRYGPPLAVTGSFTVFGTPRDRAEPASRNSAKPGPP
jgi:hypothetical protein